MQGIGCHRETFSERLMSMIQMGKADKKSIGFDLSTLIDTRLLIQANSGGGKSWAIRRLLEQSHGHVQQIVLDLEGEFSTLRQKFDYVIAGKGGDCEANPKTAKVLARRLLELNVSAICDLYDLPKHERTQFVRIFLESLMSAPKKHWRPVLIIIDEAHHFCPEKGQAESAKAVIDLMTRGRKRGFCGVLATQRLSKLHKDACAESLNKLIGRTSLDIDRKRAADELGFIGKQDTLSLRDIRPGGFYAYGPALKALTGVTRFQVGDVKSRHPSIGSRQIDAPPVPTSKIKKILGQLADLASEAKKEVDELQTLREELVILRRENRQLTKQPANSVTAEEYRDLEQVRFDTFSKYKDLRDRFDKIRNIVDVQAPDIKDLSAKPSRQPVRPVISEPKKQPEWGCHEITKSQQHLLNCLASFEKLGFEAVEKRSLAALARVSPRSGGYFNNLGKLRSFGLVEYPSKGHVCLTDSGRGIAEATIDFGSLSDLHESWLNIVSVSQAKILTHLIDIHPAKIMKSVLADMIGVSSTSGGYFNNLGKLRTLGAVMYPASGYVRASDLLFPDELT